MRRSLILLFLSAAALLAKFEITRPALHQFDGGPPIPTSGFFRPGETVFVSFHLSGFKPDVKDQISIDWQAQPTDEKGLALAASMSDKIAVELAPEDKEWTPVVRFQFELPQTLSCKACRISLKARDELGHQDAAAEITFEVRGQSITLSDSLSVQNFRFLRNEDDAQPIAVAAYRPGDPVWAKFEITGFKLGEGNLVRVEYGLSVFRPSGKLLYKEETAASAEEKSFYPKSYVPGLLNLTLDDKMPKGEYPIVIEVRDKVAGTKLEHKVTFLIE